MYVGILIGKQWQPSCFWSKCQKLKVVFPVFMRRFYTAKNDQFIHDYSNKFRNSLTSYQHPSGRSQPHRNLHWHLPVTKVLR